MEGRRHGQGTSRDFCLNLVMSIDGGKVYIPSSSVRYFCLCIIYLLRDKSTVCLSKTTPQEVCPAALTFCHVMSTEGHRAFPNCKFTAPSTFPHLPRSRQLFFSPSHVFLRLSATTPSTSFINFHHPSDPQPATTLSTSSINFRYPSDPQPANAQTRQQPPAAEESDRRPHKRAAGHQY